MKTDDEEVIERVLERNAALLKGVSVPGGLTGDQWRQCCDDQAADAPDLARRLRERNARIAVLEKALLDIADADSTNGTFDAIYRNKTLIEAARTRKGDHRG